MHQGSICYFQPELIRDNNRNIPKKSLFHQNLNNMDHFDLYSLLIDPGRRNA